MPGIEAYKRMIGLHRTDGDARKAESAAIMEASWWEDIQSQVGYLFDWYHDDHKTQLNGFRIDDKMIPIDIKFVPTTTQTYSKDMINYHLQLRPHQKCNVPYYEEYFAKRYDAQFPIGLYVLIKDARGVYNRWLIVAPANQNDVLFPTYELLRCDKIIQFIDGNIKYNVPAVLRSQNSYKMQPHTVMCDEKVGKIGKGPNGKIPM